MGKLMIHPTALIKDRVDIGDGTVIGPYVVIEEGVKIGRNNKLMQGVYIGPGTILGDDNEIHMNAVIGHTPQDLAFKNEPSFTKIGNKNRLREFVTIHRGTKPGSSTVIGDENYLMAYCHLAHNCVLGNKIITVNNASLAGYCTVEDQAFISGFTVFHQFIRIGRLAMVSALSASNKDIPPFMTAGGRPCAVLGMNVVGMRRAGIRAEDRAEIKEAMKLLYRSGLNTSQALEKIKAELLSEPVKHLVKFIETSERGLIDSAGEVEETLNARKINGLDLDEE